MKAVLFYEHGGIDKLRYEERPLPNISPCEILVRVRACSLNHLDLWARRGRPGDIIPLPHIPGSDVAGEVQKVGGAVTNVKVGDRVILEPNITCGMCNACLDGRGELCPSAKTLGHGTDGGYAEYVKAPAENAIPLPERMSFEEASCIPIVYQTAWHGLVTRAAIKPGETLLIHGAASGLGTAAIQIAKLHGAKVIATAGSDWKVKKLLDVGADVAFNHAAEDVLAVVKSASGGYGLDVIMDYVGAATWDVSVMSLKKGGRLVLCGATTGGQVQLNLSSIYQRNITVHGARIGRKSELIHLLKFFAEGKLGPVLDRVLPLSEAAKAQQLMESREHFGKIVLRP